MSSMIINDALVYKTTLIPQNSILNYTIVLCVLLIGIALILKKYKIKPTSLNGCQLIERKHLGNKTYVYIIEYQQQQFLLADNQQALSFHSLSTTKPIS